MKENAKEYLSKTVKYNGKGQIVLPEMLEWYEEDIESDSGKQDLVLFSYLRISKDLTKDWNPE